MTIEIDAVTETADDALQYALDALEKLDDTTARLFRLEKALSLLLDGHPRGAQSVLEVDIEAWK